MSYDFFMTAMLGLCMAIQMAERQREVAPLPAPAFRPSRFGGLVTDVTKSTITVRGLSFFPEGQEDEFDFESKDGRRRLRIVWGSKLVLRGSIHPIEATQVYGKRAKYGTGTGRVAFVTLRDGTNIQIREEDQPARTFDVCPALELGHFANEVQGISCYRMKDVKVGDRVDLSFLQTDDYINVVHGITITERPGGTIPPLPREAGLPDWHLRRQAEVDWQLHGTPMPMKYLTLAERRDRIAPPPREVEQK